MRDSAYSTVLILSVTFGSVGCTAVTTVVHQPEQHVARQDGTSVTQDDVKRAVIRALARRAWTVEETTDDAVVASVSAGGHSATVKVAIGPGTYTINHLKSSEGLRYDGTEIHHRYNHWVRRLDSTIMNELGGIMKVAAPGDGVAPSTRPSADDLK